MPTILILGATSDMGAAIARKFASEKYDVLLAARDAEQLRPLQSDIRVVHNVSCEAVAFDAEDFAGHAAFYSSLPSSPDVSICVFGYMNDNEYTATHLDDTLRTINVNYTGAVSILNLIAADYAKKGKGVIAGISSVAGERGRQSNYIYGSAKAGFTAYLSGLRNKMYHSRVHVLTVLPGFVYTKMTENLKLPAVLTAKPSEVADAVYKGVTKRKNVIYIKWFWRWIMLIIKLVPEPIFKKKKL